MENTLKPIDEKLAMYPKGTKFAFCVAEDMNPGASYVMSYLRNQGHDVRLFFDPKQFARGYSRNRFLEKAFSIQNWLIKEMKEFDPDVACFSVLSATYQWGLALAERVKKEVGCKIIFGGTMPTLVPEIVKENAFIDEVVQGDGIKHFGGKFDPDYLWPARWDFFNELPPEHRHTQLFMTSYGCPFNCSFCGNQQLREVGHYLKLRRTVDSCIKELKHLKKHWGMERVLFVDDILTLDKKWLLEFLPKYREKIDLPFACFGHVNAMDEERVEALAKSKCQTIWIGIQTGCEHHRKEILDRKETNEQIKKAAGWVKKHGIKLMIDHICGLPFESDMTNELSHILYSEIKPDVVNVYECLYFPKAKINEHALKCRYLCNDDIDKINRGEHIIYQQGNKSGHFYNKYAKAFVTIPLGSLVWEFLPMWAIKLVVHLKAGRGFIANAMVQNELFFTWRAIQKKLGFYKHKDNYARMVKSCLPRHKTAVH